MDATALVRSLSTQFAHVGIGQEVLLAPASGGIVVRSEYAEPITVIGEGATFRLMASGGRGIDTRIRLDQPLELLGLYIAFHALWSIHRLIERIGAADAVHQHPRVAFHSSQIVAHLGMQTASRDDEVSAYARRLLGDARTMLSTPAR